MGPGLLATLIVATFIVVLIIAFIAADQQNKATNDVFEAYARKKGWAYYPYGMPVDDNPSFWTSIFSTRPSDERRRLHAALNTFYPISRGHESNIRRMLCRSTEDGHIYAFEFSYTVSTGKSSTTYYFKVVAAREPLMFPGLDLSPETGIAKVGKFFGIREMQLESEEFNQKYFIRTTDERATSMILDPLMLEKLIAIPARHWQTSGPWMLVYESGRFERPEQKDPLIAAIHEFSTSIPELVREDYGFQPAWKRPEEV